MNTEVNISLRGFLDQLPGEVEQLLRGVITHFQHNHAALEEATDKLGSEGEVGYCLVDLDKIRRELYRIDNRIGDCMSILQGYQDHLIKATPPPPTEEQGMGAPEVVLSEE